jgi:hypothetical protein
MQGGQRHVRVIGRQCASAVSRVNIIATMTLSTAKARLLMRPAQSFGGVIEIMKSTPAEPPDLSLAAWPLAGPPLLA